MNQKKVSNFRSREMRTTYKIVFMLLNHTVSSNSFIFLLGHDKRQKLTEFEHTYTALG